MTNNGDTFQPVIREDGTVEAGGMRLFELDADSRLVFPDRYKRRQAARGTPGVPVDPVELMEQIVYWLRERGL